MSGLFNSKNAKQQITVLLCMYFGYGAMMVCRQTVPIISSAMIADPVLGLTKTTYGSIIGLGAFGALLGKLIWGPLADILNGRTTFLLGLLFSALLIIAFGVSPSVGLFSVLVVALYCAKSAGWPAMAKLIGNWYHPNKYGRIWGIISTSSRASVVVGTLVLGGMLAFMGWREVAIFSGVSALVILLVCFFFLKRAPKDATSILEDSEILSPEKALEVRVSLANKQNHPLKNSNLKQALLVFAKSKRFWLVCISLMGLTVLMEFLSFVPIFLVDNFGVSESKSAVASSIFPLGSLSAVVLGGYFYDKLSKKNVKIVMTLLLLGSVACVLLLNYLPLLRLPSSTSFKLALILIFLFGFCISPAYYLPMSVFSIEFGGIHSGVLISLIDAFGFFAAMIYAPIAGMLAESSWTNFMYLLVVVSLATTAVTWLYLHYEQKVKHIII